MISSENFRTVYIRITTYKDTRQKTHNHQSKMNDERRRCKTALNNKFICSICLNSNKSKGEDGKRDTKTPIPKSCICLEKSTLVKDETKVKSTVKTIEPGVQTLQFQDVDKSLNLLNEVLTVFQNKKQAEPSQKPKTIILKDASISTDDVRIVSKSNLRISKVFQFSIDECDFDRRNDKFTIITSHDDIVRSQYTIDLSKHKSSSIPQMKLEELKNSLKEKTKSKDAIEEVNRMFATVRKMKKNDISDDLNRPLIRNGPRILPVVKSKDPRSLNSNSDANIITPCKYCQTSDCFSSGDSFVKPEYCHHNQQDGKCDKCVYTMCCRHKNFRKMQSSVMFCDHCQRLDSCNHQKDDFDK